MLVSSNFQMTALSLENNPTARPLEGNADCDCELKSQLSWQSASRYWEYSMQIKAGEHPSCRPANRLDCNPELCRAGNNLGNQTAIFNFPRSRVGRIEGLPRSISFFCWPKRQALNKVFV